VRGLIRALVPALLLMAVAAGPVAAAWKQSGFVIGGYVAGGDPPSLIRLNDAGLALIVPYENASPTLARGIAVRLDSLRLHHPGFHLQEVAYQETQPPRTLFKNPDPVSNRAAILGELTPTSGLNNASVAGWYVWDEPPPYYPPGHTLPPARVFDVIHQMTALIRDSGNGAATSDKLALVNMFPIQAYPWGLTPCSPDTQIAYGCYLDQYLSRFDADSLPAPVLSFDKYPFEVPWAEFRLYFVQLALVRDRAALHSRPGYDIPVWSVIQASPRREKGSSPYRATPTFNQVRWQAYVSVAYGAKGVFYWTLRPNDVAADGQGYGASFLKRDGTTNGALYDSLAALNAELQALGPTLLTLEPVAVFHAAANRFVLPARDDSLARAGSPSQLVARLEGRTPEGMAGSFRSGVPTEGYVMVANKDTLIAQSFRVTLRQPATTVEHISKRDGRRIAVATLSPTTFDTGVIAPGGGELFRIVPRQAAGGVSGRP
jgi:hypothetical protein